MAPTGCITARCRGVSCCKPCINFVMQVCKARSSGKLACYCWLNTAALDDSLVFRLDGSQLDKARARRQSNHVARINIDNHSWLPSCTRNCLCAYSERGEFLRV